MNCNDDDDDDEVVEAKNIETVEELGDLPESSESSSDLNVINNVDNDAELVDNEKTKTEVSKVFVTKKSFVILLIALFEQALMECVVPVVVFQYRPNFKEIGECPENLLDDLNLWVGY